MTDTSLDFREMTEEEYLKFVDVNRESYAQEIARNYHRPVEEVRIEAKEQYSRLLPDGLKTKGHSLLSIVEKPTGAIVGCLWYNLEEEKRRAFLYYIIIFEPYRGRGYGKETMDLLAETLRKKNVKQLALHVFADNQIALNLYKRQGFETHSYNMQKTL